MVVVRFKRMVFSPRYGACGPGDILRCDEAFARHVVTDLAAAEYLRPQQPPARPALVVKRRAPRAPTAKD